MMTVEMAQDMGLIPDVDIYVKTDVFRDRLVTNEEYKKRQAVIFRKYGVDPKTRLFTPKGEE